MKYSVIQGTVIGDFGREFLVELQNTSEYSHMTCSRKGRKQDVACGDLVDVVPTSLTQARIEKIHPRRNVLYRSDAWREKTLAANVDQAIIIIAPKPTFSETFLNLCLVACEAAGIHPIIMLNKMDMAEEHAAARKQISYLDPLGYTILPMSAKFDIAPLKPHLENKVSLLVGQSGMGKSRTVNSLVLNEVTKVADYSETLDSGKHTTTFTRMYRLSREMGKDTAIIDSPGLQSFGLFHLSDDDIAHAMPEFRPYIGRCKFNDCSHTNEPHCAVTAAANAGKISTARLGFYQVLIEQLHDLHAAHPDWKRGTPE
jgi:ribosome biogenesis GTPase / thiamine phosphate phosphatase